MKVSSKIKALRQQAGYTLVELSISVAIISVLIITGLVGVPRILDTNKVSTVVQQISLANANYSKLAAGNNGSNAFATVGATYVNTTSLPLAGMGVWPDEAVQKNPATGISYGIQHPFGGNIYSRSTTAGITNFLAVDEGYILKLENIRTKNCFAVASAFGGTAMQIGVNAPATADIGSITAEPVPGTIVKAAGASLNQAALATQCATNPSIPKSIYLWFQY
jgi:prepilin-type N-terminal cleavage/methylation domain-containing protein